MPSTKYFCKAKKIIKQGIRDSTDIANNGPQEEEPVESINSRSPSGTVYLSAEFKNNNWLKKSSQALIKVKIEVVINAGTISGRMIFQ